MDRVHHMSIDIYCFDFLGDLCIDFDSMELKFVDPARIFLKYYQTKTNNLKN